MQDVDENECDITDNRIPDSDTEGHANGTKVANGGRGVKNEKAHEGLRGMDGRVFGR